MPNKPADECGALRDELISALTRFREGDFTVRMKLGSKDPRDQEIAELFTIAGRETAAIKQLTGCVEQLHEVQAAKRELASLTPAEVRAALEFRRAGLGEAQ